MAAPGTDPSPTEPSSQRAISSQTWKLTLLLDEQSVDWQRGRSRRSRTTWHEGPAGLMIRKSSSA